MNPMWYLKRLASMGPAEIVGRVEDEAKRQLWRRKPPEPPRASPPTRLPVVPADLTALVSPQAAAAVVKAADGLLVGRWFLFGQERTDATADMDYGRDVLTGVKIPDGTHSFDIDHRDETESGNIKFMWEPARHQHLSVLAAAYAVTGDDRYAERIDDELRNYWKANPFLVGIHWTSGIELGLRLISWTWIRRLLDGWAGASKLFEENPIFIDQLGRHHQWLGAFPSHGSSANNHLLAELCGQFVAASAFGCFDRSDRWCDDAATELGEELSRQTFDDGLNREQASAYHGFVLEMALAAWVEAVLTDHPIATELAGPIAAGLEALQAVVDETGAPHRQGDDDNASGLLVDPPDYDHWGSLLASAGLFLNPASWWNQRTGGDQADVRSALLAACAAKGQTVTGDPHRPRRSQFPDAGLTVIRDPSARDRGSSTGRAGTEPEIWVVMDHGPHGYLATAAHAHADALAVEIRYGGIEVVADPGTYCYHGEPEWRDYFRSTPAHATVAVNGVDQSDIGGPFLWTRKAAATLELFEGLESGSRAICTASHDGYQDLGLVHRRSVELDRDARTIAVVDTLNAADIAAAGAKEPLALSKSFPLGPTVRVELNEEAGTAQLTWPENSNRATVTLEPNLSWSVVSGRVSPPFGWYSAKMGTKQPSSVLIGSAKAAKVDVEYRTLFTFVSSQESEVEQR